MYFLAWKLLLWLKFQWNLFTRVQLLIIIYLDGARWCTSDTTILKNCLMLYCGKSNADAMKIHSLACGHWYGDSICNNKQRKSSLIIIGDNTVLYQAVNIIFKRFLYLHFRWVWLELHLLIASSCECDADCSCVSNNDIICVWVISHDNVMKQV